MPLDTAVVEEDVRYFYFHRDFVPYKVAFEFGRWLRANASHFDVVHIHAVFSYSSTAAAKAARRAGVPYVVRPLGVLNRWGLKHRRSLLKRISLRLIEIPILQRAAALHFTAEAEALEASEVIPNFEKVRRAIIPVPVESVDWNLETPAFTSLFPSSSGRELVLFLSRIDPKKGVELLLESFAIAHRSNPKLMLVVAGAGEACYVQRLRQHSKSQGLEAHVLWTGHLAAEQKSAAFASARLFVLVSASENFGIAPVEAMAAGLPIIVSREVAISAAVSENDAGLVVSRNAEEIALAIVTLATNAAMATRLALNGRRLVTERYSEEKIGTALLRLYESITEPDESRS